MRRMFVLTLAGGALASYLASPHGLLAGILAYFLGGTLCGLLGLSGYLYFGGSKERGSEALAPPRGAADHTRSSRSGADF